MNDETPRPLLTMRGAAKRFGGVQALRGGDFDLRRGEIHALNILSGVIAPDEGEMTRTSGRSPAADSACYRRRRREREHPDVAQMDNFITQKVDLILISPFDAAPLTPVAARAMAADQDDSDQRGAPKSAPQSGA